MFTIEGEPLVERFELTVVKLRTPIGLLDVPIVNEWLELQLALREIPDATDRHHLFEQLRAICAALRKERPNLQWYLLHKLPGLMLRFRVGTPDASVLKTLIGSVLRFKYRWLEGVGIGSVLDQTELLGTAFRDDVGVLLTRAADCRVDAELTGRRGTEARCAEVLVELLFAIGLDKWLAYEVFSRLRRLRSARLTGDPAAPLPLLDPSAMTREPIPEFAPGFVASLSLVQGLNLALNVWGVDPKAQDRILRGCCDQTRPALVPVADE